MSPQNATTMSPQKWELSPLGDLKFPNPGGFLFTESWGVPTRAPRCRQGPLEATPMSPRSLQVPEFVPRTPLAAPSLPPNHPQDPEFVPKSPLTPNPALSPTSPHGSPLMSPNPPSGRPSRHRHFARPLPAPPSAGPPSPPGPSAGSPRSVTGRCRLTVPLSSPRCPRCGLGPCPPLPPLPEAGPSPWRRMRFR